MLLTILYRPHARVVVICWLAFLWMFSDLASRFCRHLVVSRDLCQFCLWRCLGIRLVHRLGSCLASAGPLGHPRRCPWELVNSSWSSLFYLGIRLLPWLPLLYNASTFGIARSWRGSAIGRAERSCNHNLLEDMAPEPNWNEQRIPPLGISDFWNQDLTFSRILLSPLVVSLGSALELWFWVWFLSFKILWIHRRQLPSLVWRESSWALLSFWLELAWQLELLVASFPAPLPHESPVPPLSSPSQLKYFAFLLASDLSNIELTDQYSSEHLHSWHWSTFSSGAHSWAFPIVSFSFYWRYFDFLCQSYPMSCVSFLRHLYRFLFLLFFNFAFSLRQRWWILANFKRSTLGYRHRHRHLQLLGGDGGRSSWKLRSWWLGWVQEGLEFVRELVLDLLFSEFSPVGVQVQLRRLPIRQDNRRRDFQGEPTDYSKSFLGLPHFWARKQLLAPVAALPAVQQPLIPHLPSVVVATWAASSWHHPWLSSSRWYLGLHNTGYWHIHPSRMPWRFSRTLLHCALWSNSCADHRSMTSTSSVRGRELCCC